jgi:hypothetical protein
MSKKATAIDVPAEIVLSNLRDEIIKGIEGSEIPNAPKIKVDRIEWTKDGLRVWILQK